MYVVKRSEKAILENNVCPPKKIPAEGVTGDKNSCISNDREKKIPANWKSLTPNHFTKNSVKKAYKYL